MGHNTNLTLTYKECRLLLILTKRNWRNMASELFLIWVKNFDEKFVFSFCVEAICKQTHGQTHRMVPQGRGTLIFFHT